MARLLPGETVVTRRHQHWIVPLRSLFLPVVLAVAFVVVMDLVLRHRVLPHDVKVALTLLAVAVAGLWVIVAWIRWTATAFTLTDQRIILDAGVFSRSSKVIANDRVQDVSTRQSIIGRMLGYGRVEIDAAGSAGAEVLGDVPAPEGFRDLVFMQSERLRSSAKAAAAPAQPV